MKKLLIILTVLFSLFLFTDNVSAEDIVTFPENMFDYIHMINTKDMTNEEVTQVMTEKGFSENYINGYLNFKNHINTYQQEDKYYFFAPQSGSSLYSSRLYINLTSNGLLAYFGIYYATLSASGRKYAYPILNVRVSDSNKTYYTVTSPTDYTIKTGSSAQWITKVNAVNEYLYEDDLKDIYYFYETNMSIPISYSSDTGVYTGDLFINNETYTLNSTLPYNTLTGVNMAPSIKVEEIDSSYVNINSLIESQSFKTSATYNISFTDYNELIYDYYYSLDNINWISIFNDYQLKVIDNGTYYFKITDKENNIVTITSLDITQLKSLDYIKVKFDVNDIIENNNSIDFQVILNNDNNLKAKPYIETFYYDNGKYIEYREELSKEDENFSYNLIQDLNTTVYYNYVLDLIDYYDNIDLTFTSNNSVGFEIVYYLNDGQVLTTGLEEYTSIYPENYNLVKLDLSSSSGIMVMPKNYSTNDVFSNFYNGDIQHIGLFGIYLNGNFRIRNYTKNGYLRLTSDSNNKNFYYGNTEFNVENNISYPFPTDNGYLIIKQESDMGSRGDSTNDYIILDTERFTYKIMVNDSEKPTINHPNNENITITGPSISESDIEDKVLNSSKDETNINSIVDLLNSNKGILTKVFAPITTIWNNLKNNAKLYTYLLIVLGGSILVYIIKSMK